MRSSISRTLRGSNRRYSQAFDEPLHDTEVVHHLHEGDEEDDGRELERGRCQDRRCGECTGIKTHSVHEEPVVVDDVGAEEERGALERLREKVAREERDPLEDREARPGLEHEHRDHLLQEQPDENRRPVCFPHRRRRSQKKKARI